MRPHIWSLQLRVSPARKARWQHLAAAANRTLSNWIAHTIEDAGAQTEAPHVALQPPRPGALPPDTPSLRKLADIHGVSRSTVHRIVQAQ